MNDGDFGRSERLESFRNAVLREFGPNLEKATPANVREFLDRHQSDISPTARRDRIELHESKTSYEEILKDFFARVLEQPTDEALITLWTLAFELSFFFTEQHVSERLQSLFGDPGEDGV